MFSWPVPGRKTPSPARFSTIVLLRPEGAAPEAPLLRMELDKDNWQAVPDKDRLTVSVPPEAILLLES